MDSKQVSASGLKLKDVVDLDFQYGYATVTNIKDGVITLFRPYVHTSDFSYTGGVIPYIGFEIITVSQHGIRSFMLVSD